jgi:hypothetical protein
MFASLALHHLVLLPTTASEISGQQSQIDIDIIKFPNKHGNPLTARCPFGFPLLGLKQVALAGVSSASEGF